jgi:hypothetical protein
MKNIIKYLIIAAILLYSTTLVGNTISDTSLFIINGVINNVTKTLKANSKCKLYIFEENKLVDSIVVRAQRPFEIKIKENLWYTLKLTNENTIPIMISFDARTNNNKIKDNTFFFEVEFLSKEKVAEINYDMIELPVGHAYFNQKTGAIELRKNYSKFYYSNIYKVNEKQNFSKQEDLAIKSN